MASHARQLKPGQAQLRRAAFCLKMLGLLVVVTFVSAVTVGLLIPSLWQSVFVPGILTFGVLLICFEFIFLLRALWVKGKAKHYETLMKLETDPRFK